MPLPKAMKERGNTSEIYCAPWYIRRRYIGYGGTQIQECRLKTFTVSALDPRVRDIQAGGKTSLAKAMNIIEIQDLKNFLVRGGDTKTVVHGLTIMVERLITQQE